MSSFFLMSLIFRSSHSIIHSFYLFLPLSSSPFILILPLFIFESQIIKDLSLWVMVFWHKITCTCFLYVSSCLSFYLTLYHIIHLLTQREQTFNLVGVKAALLSNTGNLSHDWFINWLNQNTFTHLHPKDQRVIKTKLPVVAGSWALLFVLCF